MSPVLGGITSALVGTDLGGEKSALLPWNAGNQGEILKLATPLIVSDIIKVYRENGISEGTALSLMSFMGISMQTMEDHRREKISTHALNLLYDNAIPMGQLKDDTQVWQIMGKRFKGTPMGDVKLSYDQREELLKASTAAVEQAIRTSVAPALKNAPTDPDAREDHIQRITTILSRNINNARKTALSKMIRDEKVKPKTP